MVDPTDPAALIFEARIAGARRAAQRAIAAVTDGQRALAIDAIQDILTFLAKE